MIDNPPAFPCVRCAAAASHKQGRQWLCPKHYRFGQMRAAAKRNGKTVPTAADLDELTPSPFDCQDCGEPMNWLGRDGHTQVATLQHYRDGTHGIVCRSCNTRHAFMPNDDFRGTPKEHKFCPECEAVKPFAAFARDAHRSGPLKLKSWCRVCSGLAHAEWQNNNRDHYNAKQRERRARRASNV